MRASQAIDGAMRIAREPRAVSPDKVYTGPLQVAVPGRTDRLNIHIPGGSYVFPADYVSAIGEHNTLAGFKVIERIYGKAKSWEELQRMGITNATPAVVAGGEYILDPTQVARVGKGDLTQGHNTLDALVMAQRKRNIKTLKKLPQPAKD